MSFNAGEKKALALTSSWLGAPNSDNQNGDGGGLV